MNPFDVEPVVEHCPSFWGGIPKRRAKKNTKTYIADVALFNSIKLTEFDHVVIKFLISCDMPTLIYIEPVGALTWKAFFELLSTMSSLAQEVAHKAIRGAQRKENAIPQGFP